MRPADLGGSLFSVFLLFVIAFIDSVIFIFGFVMFSPNIFTDITDKD
jgi:hypothetical protein